MHYNQAYTTRRINHSSLFAKGNVSALATIASRSFRRMALSIAFCVSMGAIGSLSGAAQAQDGRSASDSQAGNAAVANSAVSQSSPSITRAASHSDNVIIILDDSGSMRERMQRDRGTRMDAAKAALEQVIGQIDPNTNVGILLLNGARQNKNWLVPFGTLNKDNAIQRIRALQPGGGTPLGEAMRVAANAMLELRSKNFYGTYRLVVVTDGEASDPQLLAQFLPDILSRGLLVDAIGVDMKSDHSLATKVHSYRRANDLQSLSNAIQEILAEQPQQDQAGSDADFALLEALGDVDVSEVLTALAKPNNGPITGIPSHLANAPSNGGASSNGWVSMPSPASPATAVQTPDSSHNTTRVTSFTGWLTQVVGTICSCFVPLILILIFLFAILNSKKSGRSGGK